MKIINRNYLMRFIISFLILMIMVLVTYYINKTSVLRSAGIKNGWIDLSNWDEENEIFTLDGEWRFYPEMLCGSETVSDSSRFVNVPESLGNSKDSLTNTAEFGTYEIQFKLRSPGHYMLCVPYISSAYRIYVNNEYIGGVGRVATNEKDEVGVLKPDNYLINADSTELNIKIEISNFTCVKGGITEDIYFGTVSNIYKYTTNKNINDILMVGILIGFGVFPLLILSKYNKGRSGYYFAGFCIASAVFAFLINHNIGGIHIFCLPIKIIVKAEFTTFIIMLMFIYAFIKSVYPYKKSKDRTNILICIDVIYIILIFISGKKRMMNIVGNSYSVILLINAVFCIYIIIRAMPNKKIYALFSFSGIIIFLILGGLEIIALEMGGSIRFYLKDNFYNIGLLVFVLCHINIFLMDIDQAYLNASYADKMEISFLHAQIAPHFLFNTLNNLYVLMEMDLEKARKLLINLSDFLKVKYRFNYKDFDEYSLLDEVDFLKSYTAIENLRRGDKIRLSFDFEGVTMSSIRGETDILTKDMWFSRIKFQPMILQPLVENAIRHGFKSEVLEIVIHVKRAGEYLDFLIEDNGAGIPEFKVKMLNRSNSHGVGIPNINYRLSKYCDEKLVFESEEQKGTKIRFRYRMEEVK